MKYWRGYLTAAVIAFFTWMLVEFAQANSLLIDMVYPYVSRMMQGYLADWSSSVDYLVWQLAVVIFAVGVLASIVLMIVLRWNPIQWFGWIVAVASLVFFLHTGIYGLNYYAGPLADDIHLNTLTLIPDDTGSATYTQEELSAATAYYRDKANELAQQIQRDGDGAPLYPAFRTLAEQAGEGFNNLVYDYQMPIFAGSLVPVKELGFADAYTSMGITGFTLFLTGEAAVNPQIPQVGLPFTMCHEMAHRMCIAIERDANMAAFLACQAHSSPEFQYSGYFMAYRYCYSALASLDSAAAQEVAGGVSELLSRDLESYSRFFRENKIEAATQAANTVNDFYLKASGDKQGIASYDKVCDLLVSWHIQEVVLPSQIVEEEDPFDPFEVDLNATLPTEEANG